MGFASGSVSFRRFAVAGDAPKTVDQALLDKLAEHALKPAEFGVPEEVEYGWSGGRHISTARSASSTTSSPTRCTSPSASTPTRSPAR
jgi:hypothetical protein